MAVEIAWLVQEVFYQQEKIQQTCIMENNTMVYLHGAGLSFHEKTLLGLMGWWMAMNFIGIIYALMAVDFKVMECFRKKRRNRHDLKKLLRAFISVVSLGVFGTRPRPSGDPIRCNREGGGKKSSFSNIIKFLVLD